MNSCATLSLKSVKGEQSPATPYLTIVFTRLGYGQVTIQRAISPQSSSVPVLLARHPAAPRDYHMQLTLHARQQPSSHVQASAIFDLHTWPSWPQRFSVNIFTIAPAHAGYDNWLVPQVHDPLGQGFQINTTSEGTLEPPTSSCTRAKFPIRPNKSHLTLQLCLAGIFSFSHEGALDNPKRAAYRGRYRKQQIIFSERAMYHNASL